MAWGRLLLFREKKLVEIWVSKYVSPLPMHRNMQEIGRWRLWSKCISLSCQWAETLLSPSEYRCYCLFVALGWSKQFHCESTFERVPLKIHSASFILQTNSTKMPSHFSVCHWKARKSRSNEQRAEGIWNPSRASKYHKSQGHTERQICSRCYCRG